MNILLKLGICIALLCQLAAQAVVIGSNNAVSLISTCTFFPAADNDNTMLGFGWFKGGFTFEDQTTSCTFSSVYPVSGTVNMNGGTLYLTQDVLLANPTQLQGLGAIIGNGHSIEFCETITVLPTNLSLIKDLNVFFNGNVELTSTLTVQGTCCIDAGQNIFSLSDNAQIIIDTGSQLWKKNEAIENINNNITCVDDTSSLMLENVTVQLTGDLLFPKGSIICQGLVQLNGGYTLWYNSAQPCQINMNYIAH